MSAPIQWGQPPLRPGYRWPTEHERREVANDRRTMPGVFDLRRQLGRAPTVAEYRASRGLDR